VFLGTVEDNVLIWSALSPCGHSAAVAFATEDEAHRFLDGLPAPFPGCEIAEVEADEIQDGTLYASLRAICEAGLPTWDPQAQPLLTMPPAQT
jgi:hypothetical protein